MKFALLVFFSLMSTLATSSLFGQTETPVFVRVMAKDAKWIGTSMGGVEITIRDHSTGELLASGLTAGNTGDTDLLVHNDKSRYGQLSTPGSAAFETSLQLKKPIFAEIKATFRSAYSGQPIIMSQTQWLIPGKEMTEDGIVFEMPGFAMRIEYPLPHQSVSMSSADAMRIDLFMIMLCGCPIAPGGTWDSDPMEVEAMVFQKDKLIHNISFSNVETNHFTADLSVLPKGSYEVFVSAYDPRSKNTGVEKIQVTVKE